MTTRSPSARRRARAESARRRRERGTPPGWVLTTNEWIDAALFTIGVSLVWLVLSLLGLFVLGIAPATCAAADVTAARRREEEPSLIPDMWRAYRTQFLGANTRLLPFVLVQIAAGLSVAAALRSVQDAPVLSAVMGTLALLAGCWATLSAMSVVAAPRVRRQDWPVTMRLALLLPGALPGPALAALIAVGLWSMVSLLLPPVGALAGPAVAVRISVALLAERISALLACIDTDRGSLHGVED